MSLCIVPLCYASCIVEVVQKQLPNKHKKPQQIPFITWCGGDGWTRRDSRAQGITYIQTKERVRIREKSNDRITLLNWLVQNAKNWDLIFYFLGNNLILIIIIILNKKDRPITHVRIEKKSLQYMNMNHC